MLGATTLTTERQQNSLFSSIPETIGHIYLVASSILNPITAIFTQPLADFLGLETLRHGTTWNKYLKIHHEGAKPSFGGQGACVGFQVSAREAKHQLKQIKADNYVKNSQGYFFVNRDSTVGTDFEGNLIDIFAKFDHDGISKIGMGRVTNKPPTLYQKCLYQVFIRAVPRFYAWMAGVAAGAQPKEQGVLAKIKRIASGCFNILSPTVKIRFRPEDLVATFEDDPLLIGSALRTNQAIDASHLGIKGIFIQGYDDRMWERMSANPQKSFYGTIRLINPIGITLLAAFGAYVITQKASGSQRKSQKLN